MKKGVESGHTHEVFYLFKTKGAWQRKTGSMLTMHVLVVEL